MFPGLVDGSLAVYEWSLKTDGFTLDDITRELDFEPEEAKAIVANLLELQLVQSAPKGDARFVPVDPGLASLQVLRMGESDLLKQKLLIEQLRSDFAQLGLLFRSSKFGVRFTSSFDIVKGAEAARALVREEAASTSYEVVAMWPGSWRPVEEVAGVESCDIQMLKRGVRLRFLFQHAARFDMPTREHAGELIELGAKIRTAGALFGDLLIFDRKVAYLLLRGEDEGVVVVQEPALVDCLYSCFEYLWSIGKEFDTRRAEVGAISSDMKREIVTMLISGAKDETVARNLGISVRTCRKHIGQVMQAMGATSRFQLGYLVKEANLGEEP